MGSNRDIIKMIKHMQKHGMTKTDYKGIKLKIPKLKSEFVIWR